MKKLAFIAVALAALASTPAYADAIKGPRIEAKFGFDTAAYDDVSGISISHSGAAYSGEVGYDVPIDSKVSLGLDLEATGSTNKIAYGGASLEIGRDLYAGARVTISATHNLNLYAKAGYANGRLVGKLGNYKVAQNGDGFRVGLGAQYLLSEKLYASVEYRYTTYQDDISRSQVLTGLGVSF